MNDFTRTALSVVLLVTALCGCTVFGPKPAAAPVERPAFTVFYTAWIKADEQVATVKISLSKHPEWVNWMRFYIGN